MAAYGAVVSVRNTLSQLPSNQQIRADLDDGVNYLQCFLGDNRDVERQLEIQIRDAVYEVQDLIDSHMMLSAETNSPSFCSELEKLIQTINSIAGMTRLKEFNHRKISNSVWKRYDEIEAAKWTLVGRWEDMVQLNKLLFGGSEALELVSVFGIAGMGKTHLVQIVFMHVRLEQFFGVCGWCKVPREYKKRDLLSALLLSMNNESDEIHQMTDDQLEKHFYDFLRNKTYLVWLDDVHDIVVWDDLKELFPNHYNGSRILLTTRDEAIASIAHSSHRLAPLSNEDALELLRNIVFLEEPCPHELLVIAEDIAKSCKGLPRAVVIVGRLLRCANLSRAYWELVLSSILTCDGCDEVVEALVSLTYKHMPQYLRACLLYMAMFPYDYEIPVDKLMHLWIAEGILEMVPGGTGSKQEMESARVYFYQLYDRGLIFFEVLNDVITCRIDEEVFHDFGLRTVTEENFSFIINKDTKDVMSSHDQLRRLFICKSIIPLIIQDFPQHHNLHKSISKVRSLFYYGPEHQYPLRPFLEFSLLKVLDILKIRFYSFPPEIFKLLLLRYLSLSYNGQLPVEVCKLHNLQFLIVSRYLSVKCSGVPSYLPVEIWDMKQLRHLQVMGSDIPLNTDLILENLLSLLDVSAHSCSRQILERLPHLRDLGVRIESLPEEESLSFFNHLDILDELFTFKCVVVHPNIGSQVAPCPIPAFPGTLIEIILSGCGFPWEYMRVIAALPKLARLQLENYAFQGPVWEVKKDEFPRLNGLWLEDTDLEDLILADESCFPNMTRLVMRHCYKLHKIPDALGDSPELWNVQVVNCSTSAMASIQAIKEKVRRRDDFMDIVVYSSRDD